ncbi:MAG: hypothetical protein HYU97_08805 [Deltaproteobacteria bacterium]|nr:hypothetical protein [Deltaproteobacteria bacterium]
MKTFIITTLAILITAISSPSWAYVNVNGYFKSNGTYVSPHIRSYPDGNPYNNLSSFNMNQSPLNSSPFNPNIGMAVSKV